VKAARADVRIIGVEPESAADAKESLAAGRVPSCPSERTLRTIADGLRTQSLSELTFSHIEEFVGEIVTVTNDQIAEAVGPCGAWPPGC
jgi:Threonine dehydratase